MATPRSKTTAPPRHAAAQLTDTRERILRVAAEAWHARSFDGIGTAELCRRAEVHKGSFFHFFASKDELLLAVLARYAEQIGPHLRGGAFARDVAPLARFERFFADTAATARRELAAEGCMRGCPIGNLVLELSTRSAAVQQAAARVFDEMQAVFKEALDEAVATGELASTADTAGLATTVLSLLQGLAVIGKAYAGVDRLHPVVAHVMALLRDGARG